MFRLRKTEPPYGTEEVPLWEHAYAEQVKVVNGVCEVQDIVTRDYLLKIGYQEIQEEKPAIPAADIGQKSVPDSKSKPKKKARK